MPARKPRRPFAFAAAAQAGREGHRGVEAAERVPLLIIVARTDAALCRCVTEAFATCESARVILDRRRHERRQAARPVGVDRRSTDRRDYLAVGEQLRSGGWAFIYRPFV